MGVKGYKGFNKDFMCLEKQYEENTTYEEHGTEICEKGVMHFCKEPWDVLYYYPFLDSNAEFNKFAEVEALGDVFEDGDKSATTKLHVGAKLGFKDFLNACIDFTLERTKPVNPETITLEDIPDLPDQNYASESNSAQIGSSGDYAQIGSSGDDAKIGSSGDYAKIGSSGDSAQIGSSGDYAKIGSSGDYAQIGSSGNSATINSSGENSVIMAAGADCVAKAKKGSWITLAEWMEVNGRFVPVCVKTEQVDGVKIKENTYYKLADGEFQEARINE